jgi:2-polyprenyl-3-methyl-5-hydroxy-6-metoxy-1,4-benzoquinol methylase
MRSGTAAQATGVLLDALAALGLLEKRNDAYSNVPAILKLLEDPSETVMSYLRHQSNSWRNWSALTEVVRKGRQENRSRDQAENFDFAGALRLGCREAAERMNLMIDFSGIRHICDMGCGPGALCMELLQMHHELRATLVDRDRDALSAARRHAESRGVQDRVEIVCGDIFTTEFDRRFDMVVMSLVLCLFFREEVSVLLRKAKAALQPGGILLLGEVLLDSSGTSRTRATLFNTHLLVSGARGGLYSLDAICDLLRESGFGYRRNFPTNLYEVIVGSNESE